MTIGPGEIKDKIEDLVSKVADGVAGESFDIVSTMKGKLYEGFILALLLAATRHMGDRINFIRSTKSGATLILKSSPGPINTDYPYFEISRRGNVIAWIFTNVEFIGLSCVSESRHSTPRSGDCHEMDIGVIGRPAGDNGWHPTTGATPRFDQVLLVIECKDTKFLRSMLRELLGLRRELSMHDGTSRPATFPWPLTTVSHKPASGIAVFSTSSKVMNFSSCGTFFGIHFEHQPM